MIHTAESLDAEPVRPRAALRLRRPCGGTLGLALMIIALGVGTGEILVRTAPVRATLLAPSFGSSLREAELHRSRLERAVADGGPIDCLFIGSSSVRQGLDPQAFAEAYRRHTGGDIHCFNFGVPGMTASTAGMMAEIIVRRYHPRLLVYGASPFDFSERAYRASKATRGLEGLPWVQYQLGTFTLTGWLVEHSDAYRRYLTHRNWMRPTYWQYLADTRAWEAQTLVLGYLRTRQSQSITVMPDAEKQKFFSNVTLNYRLSDARLDALARMARLRDRSVRVIVVEMPLPRTMTTFFPGAEIAYREFFDAVDSVERARGLPFWRTTSLHLVPDDGWADYGHMNTIGAQALASWVGEQVAALESRPAAADSAAQGLSGER
jgi:hypothetical protein